MDYRSVINPTYLTAKTTLFMLAGAGDEDAKKMIELLGTKNELEQNRQAAKGQLDMPDSEKKALMTGSSLAVEARYAAVSRYMQTEGYTSLLDIACGYTPRSVYCAKNGIDYVGLDVPVVAEELQKVVEAAGIGIKHPVYVGGDATNAASMRTAADFLGGKLLISCEGLTQYLSEDEFGQLAGGIREILLSHGGAWITSDFGVQYMKFATANMSSPDAIALYTEARSQALGSSNIVRKGVAAWETEKKLEILRNHGFTVNRVPFYHGDEKLNLLSGIPETWKNAYVDLLNECRLWVMTADASANVPVVEGAKEVQNLKISYAKKDSTLHLQVSGRVDTLSAPALLEVIESNLEGVKRLNVDAAGLQYISSAGLRVFLMAHHKLGKDSVVIANVSEAVRDIFDTTGFSDIFLVEQ